MTSQHTLTPQDLVKYIADSAENSEALVTLDDYAGTWRDILAAAEETMQWLSKEGIGQGDVVAITAAADRATLATILASWGLGAAVTVFAEAASTKRLRTNAQATKRASIAASAGEHGAQPVRSQAEDTYREWLHARLAQVHATVLVTPNPELEWPSSAGPQGRYTLRNPVRPRPLTEPIAILQLTSGSTGDPKTVPVTASAVLANVAATSARFGLSASDSVVSWLPLNHDMGLIGTFVLPALHGIPLRLSTPDSFIRSPMSWPLELSRSRATLTFAPHFAYGLIARFGAIRRPPPDTDLSALRHCVNGSEPINADEFRAFGEFAAEYGMPSTALRPGYGMAEVGLVLTAVEPGTPVNKVTVDPNSLTEGTRIQHTDNGTTLVGCGQPLDGYRVSIRTTRGTPLPAETVGEICLHGPSLFGGYLDTARKDHFWPDGHYRSGDLGFLRDGEIFVCGRIKDVIIVRGENLVPQDIERQVGELSGVRAGNVVAFGAGEPESVVIVAETTRQTPELRNKILSRVRETINIRPADVVLLRTGQLPKTTSGKMQRSLCKRTYLNGAWSA